MKTTQDDLLSRLRAADPVDERARSWGDEPEARAAFERIVASPRNASKILASRVEAPPRRPYRIAILAGLVLAMVLALVLGALPGSERVVTPATAAEALRAAARAVETGAAQPPLEPGQFGYVRSENAYAAQVGGADGTGIEPWAYIHPSINEKWISPQGTVRLLYRGTGDARFFGERDERRCVDQLGRAGCEEMVAFNDDLDDTFKQGQYLIPFGHGGITYEELLALPTQEEALEERMRRAAADFANADYEMFVMVGDMLREPLTPSDLRAALYRVAAGIPGVELVGQTTDPRGRPATAITITTAGHVTPSPEPGSGDIRQELLFSEETGDFLGERNVVVRPIEWADAEVGTVIGYSVYLEFGVVDSSKERP